MADTELVQQYTVFFVCIYEYPHFSSYGTDTQRDCKIYEKSIDIQDLYRVLAKMPVYYRHSDKG